MKKSELFFSAIQLPFDFLALVFGSICAFWLRHVPQVMMLRPKLYNFPFQDYMMIVLMIVPFFLVIYAIEGLYNIRATRRFTREAFRVFVATSLGLVLIIIVIFLQQQWFSSRFIILAAWFLGTFYVVLFRLILRLIQKWLIIKRGIGVHRLLLIGDNQKIKNIRRVIKNDPGLGYRIVDEIETASVVAIKKIRIEKGIDDIILCDPTITDAEQEKLIDYCSIHNVAFQYIPTTLQTSRIDIRTFANGEPIIEVKHTPLDGWGKILKRIFDLVGAAILIILISPILLLIAVLIWIESPGPVIYKNERIGSNGKKFFVYKFRYMKWEYSISKDNPDLEKAMAFERQLIAERNVRSGPLYKIKDDPRKTRIGRFIEKYSLDELPQFFNVIKGDMSLVGPRPHQEREVDKYKEYHRRLLTINPGISGLAQISGRSDLDFEDEYLLDVYYIENWSLWMDIIICLKTVGVLFRRRKNTK